MRAPPGEIGRSPLVTMVIVIVIVITTAIAIASLVGGRGRGRREPPRRGIDDKLRAESHI